MSAASAAWSAGIERVHADAGGVLDLRIIHPEGLAHLTVDAMLGDVDAHRLLQAALHTTNGIAKSPRRRPALCACCPRAVRPRDRFVLAIALPWRDDPSQALGMALCERCSAGTHSELVAKAALALRRIWPDLRAVQIGEGGRA